MRPINFYFSITCAAGIAVVLVVSAACSKPPDPVNPVKTLVDFRGGVVGATEVRSPETTRAAGGTPVPAATELGASANSPAEGTQVGFKPAEPNPTSASLDEVGSKLIKQHCVQCHLPQQIEANEKSSEEWAAILMKMQAFGVLLNENDKATLIAYLVARSTQSLENK